MISELKTPSSTAAPKLSTIAGALLVIALVVFAAGLCVNPGRANDLFWQLKTGQLILQRHSAPHFDEYSWTRHGTPWVAHEWLTFVLFRLSYDWKGFAGVWLLTAALTSAITVVLYRLVLRETRLASAEDGAAAPITACLLTAFAMITAGAFFQPRPQLFTYLFTLITIGTVLHVRRKTSSSSRPDALKRAERPLWYLVPLFILWANLHAGVLAGLALLAIFAIGDAGVDTLAKRSGSPSEGRPWKTLAIVTACCFVATLITPYSYHEYENFAATITNTAMLNGVGEWAAPNFHDPFGKLFEAFALIMLAALFLSRVRRDPAELAILGLLAHEALTGSRNVPLFALVGVVLMGRHFQSTLVRLLYGKSDAQVAETPADSLFGPAPSTAIVAAVAVAIIFSGMMRTASTLKQSAPPSGSIVDRIALASIAYGDYPDRACAFIKHERFPVTMHMYNTYDDGGFMIWRLPEYPVFVDSRADVYFGSMFADVKKVTDGALDWRSVMDRHNVDFIVSPASEAQSRGYLAAPDWALVYVDRPDIDKHPATYDRNNTFIFVRRTPQYADLIARCRRDCPAIASGKLQSYGEYLSLR